MISTCLVIGDSTLNHTIDLKKEKPCYCDKKRKWPTPQALVKPVTTEQTSSLSYSLGLACSKVKQSNQGPWSIKKTLPTACSYVSNCHPQIGFQFKPKLYPKYAKFLLPFGQNRSKVLGASL